MKTKAELIVVPLPGTGHLVPTLELARALSLRDDRIRLTILLMDDSPISPTKPSPPPLPPTDRIRLVQLPSLPRKSISQVLEAQPILSRVSLLVDHYKPIIRDTVTRLASSTRIDGFVFDVFTTNVLDVAEELGVPSYMYFTGGVAMLGLMLHLPDLDARVETESERVDSDEFTIPSFLNSVPLCAFPSFMFDRKDEEYNLFVHFSRNMTKVKGFLVNSFRELEPYAVDSIEKSRDRFPIMYLVGAMISESKNCDGSHFYPIMEFLNKQPPKSVIFLCFGSLGSLDPPQVTEMARGLEKSGHRFLWSLRGVADLEEGFEERTAGRGLIVRGWTPQVKVLEHEAIGCFVSHCGWNSTLESVRSGVPLLTWPLYAEQKLNAFELVREIGVAIEVRGWEKREGEVTCAEEVERGVRSVMDEGHVAVKVRERVGEMREASRNAVEVGGSSYVSMGHFIEDLMSL
ncbi:hypothetical protein Scep_026370 [Stephania cephalantha]|uniref:Glycosyltransferase n=1 Tax=Stephania cephalantha TaxID=152367 RepID=A0AAP0EK17_9MAGN